MGREGGRGWGGVRGGEGGACGSCKSQSRKMIACGVLKASLGDTGSVSSSTCVWGVVCCPGVCLPVCGKRAAGRRGRMGATGAGWGGGLTDLCGCPPSCLETSERSPRAEEPNHTCNAWRGGGGVRSGKGGGRGAPTSAGPCGDQTTCVPTLASMGTRGFESWSIIWGKKNCIISPRG